MAFELTVKMGGLCLLLERNDYAGRGLFALMPNSAHHPHMAVFEYNPANNAGNGSGVAPINGHDLDLTGHLAGGNMVGLPVEVAPLSRYAGGAPVDPKWTASGFPAGLLCRVRFDLGHRVVPYGDLADMKVMWNGHYERRYMTGLVRLTFTVAGNSLSVAGFTLTAGSDARMEIGFYNAPDGDFRNPGRDHPEDEEQPHFGNYYALLDGLPNGPLPRTARPHPGPSGFNLGTFLIDPVQCTVGGGCPTSNPC